MAYLASPVVSVACPITVRHWLPKIATAILPGVGIFISAFLENRVRKEVPITASTPLQIESLRHQNHYKIGIIVNALICMITAITCVALGILSISAGVNVVLSFGTLAVISMDLLHRDISHIRDLENGL